MTSLEDRIHDLCAEIDRAIETKVAEVMAACPNIPEDVIRNILSFGPGTHVNSGAPRASRVNPKAEPDSTGRKQARTIATTTLYNAEGAR